MDQNEIKQKVTDLRRMYEVLTRKEISDVALFSIVEALFDISALEISKAVNWIIRNDIKVHSPTEIREGIEEGRYRTRERVFVQLSDDQREASYWKEDMDDCGISDEEEYKKHVADWERDNPGLSYCEEIVKRGRS